LKKFEALINNKEQDAIKQRDHLRKEDEAKR
jgi:hypothetical protein